MSQWISIEAAAEKYRLEKEYIWLKFATGRFMENGGGTIRKTAILREEFYVGQRYL